MENHDRNIELDRIDVETVRIRILPDGRMTRRHAAAYIGAAEKTIAMWDLHDPNMLQSVKIGGRRFYYKDKLDAFIGGKRRHGKKRG
jgi:hypothetical protein